MDSIRSIVWVGAGEQFAAEVAAENPSLDIVWESDVEGALGLGLDQFDAMIVACEEYDRALDTLAKLAADGSAPPILVRVDADDPRQRDELLARGAAEVIAGPDGPDGEVANARLLERLGALSGRRSGRRSTDDDDPTSDIVGSSRPMQDVFALIGHASRTRVTVLITGETGTGKELLARAIHRKSRRRRRRFIAVNCAAFPETLLESELFGHAKGSFTGADRDKKGLFEVANGGTLFLDEVGETSRPFQAKLLRVLQEREVRAVGSSHTRAIDVRVIAATNRDLRREGAGEAFRSDLYYRLAVFPIHVPPLRERPGDVLPLAEHFLSLHGDSGVDPPPRLSPKAKMLLQSYGWPGNVRELENEIQRALAVADPGEELTPSHFSERLSGMLEPVRAVVQPGETLRETMRRIEAWLIRRALDGNDGRRAVTARGLGITREGLYN